MKWLIKEFLSISLLLSLSVTSFKSYSQTEWAPIGAKWCNEYGDLMTGEYFYMTMQSVKDTIIHNISCREIDVYDYYYDASSHHKSTKYSGCFFMFIDSNKVYYFYQNDVFRLLYDFSLQKGDTLHSYQPVMSYLTPIIYDTIVTSNSYIIDSVNIIQISGKNLKRQYLHLIYSDTSCHTCLKFYKGQIIERIGYNQFIFGEIQDHSDYYGPYFKCYHDNEIDYKKQQSFNCDGFNSINDKNVPETIKLYPNPVANELILEYSGNIPFYFEIINNLGIRMTEQNNLTSVLTSVKVESLKPGVYYLIIKNDKTSLVKKFLKQ